MVCPSWGALEDLLVVEPSLLIPEPAPAPPPAAEPQPDPESAAQPPAAGETKEEEPAPPELPVGEGDQVVEVIPPWRPGHPDHHIFLQQLAADGLVLLTEEDLSRRIREAADARQVFERRLQQVASVTSSTSSAVPAQDASTQTETRMGPPPEVRLEPMGAQTRLHLSFGGSTVFLDVAGCHIGSPQV